MLLEKGINAWPFLGGFYNSVNGDRTYDADQFGSLFDGIIAPGVFPNVGDKFRVRPTNNGMSVYVGAGKAWLNNRWVENSGDETVAITGSHATLDRIDLVCIESTDPRLSVAPRSRWSRVPPQSPL